MPTQWLISDSRQESSKKISEYFGISEISGQLLINRGLDSSNKIRSYLYPNYDMLNDPFLFSNMRIIVGRIQQAINDDEIICIYGDYDVDGTTATALLIHTFRHLGAKCIYFIPDRYTDGYGINENAINKIANKGATLIITVDCGITAVDETNYARELNIDMIITDHHEPTDDIPLCYGILNPKMHDETYPFDKLAGVGIAFKLAQALLDDDEFAKELLDLVAIGTVVDIASITGENRVLTYLGLQQINSNRRLGVKALCERSNIYSMDKVSGSDLSFSIGPQMNSAGRLNHASGVVELLTSGNYEMIYQMADNLYETNNKRKAIEREILKSIMSELKDIEIDEVIVADIETGDKRALGVIGIAASKLVDKYNRPSFVLCMKDDVYSGSGRSTDGVHLADALMYCTDLLESHGGHQAAAGLSIKPENIDKFRERINAYVKDNVDTTDKISKINVDMELPLSAITIDIIKEIGMFEPFGMDNDEPLFVANKLSIDYDSVITMGRNDMHLKMNVIQGDTSLPMIMWNQGDHYDALKFDDILLDAVFSVQINKWNNRENIQLICKDFRINEKETNVQ